MRITLISVLLVASVGCGFGKFKCKSMQAEAEAGLKTVQAGMVAAHTESGRYPRVLQATGFKPTSDNYEFKVVKADDATGFVVEAVGKGEMAGDHWQIDQLGKLTAVTNKCD